ncbi:AraC family transcriptional regulator [Paenibacillus ferrarius]|uniref:AraC family transcriptional regulator n=1 Tax=Paenibacillus ferrarius TaxID=1469647 RepID=UPI003D2785BC
MNNTISLPFNSIVHIQDLGFHKINHLYTHPNRTLTWHVFLYVASGEMHVWEEETEYVIKQGEYLFLKSGLYHWGEPRTPAGTSWYWIHFYTEDNSENNQSFSMNVNTYPSLSISQDEYRKMIMLPKQGAISNNQKFELKLDSLLQFYKSGAPFRAITLSLRIMELFIDIFNASMDTLPLTKSDRTVQRIIDYLENKERYNLDSEELSSSLDMNYSYLCEVFKMKTGCTIHTYNAQIFVDKAANLMRSSSLNVSEISERLGFKNPFYFSRVFRKMNGCAPSDYMSKIYRSSY